MVAPAEAPAEAGMRAVAKNPKPANEKKARIPKVPNEKKPRGPKPASLSHPTYFQMIKEAIVALKEKGGSSPYAIAKHMDEKYRSVLPANFRKMLTLQLKNCLARGKLAKVKGSFKLSEAGKKPTAAKKDAAVGKEKKSLKGPVAAAAKPKGKPDAKKKKRKAPPSVKSATTAKSKAARSSAKVGVKKAKSSAKVGVKKAKSSARVGVKKPRKKASPAKPKQPKSIKSPAAKKARKAAAA